MSLGAEVMRALATVAWADRRMEDAEAKALVRVAESAGLSPVDLQAVRDSIATPVHIEDIGPLVISKQKAEYVYALAWLIMSADGTISDAERAALDKLGDYLKLGPDVRAKSALASLAVSEALGADAAALKVLKEALEDE